MVDKQLCTINRFWTVCRPAGKSHADAGEICCSKLLLPSEDRYNSTASLRKEAYHQTDPAQTQRTALTDKYRV